MSTLPPLVCDTPPPIDDLDEDDFGDFEAPDASTISDIDFDGNGNNQFQIITKGKNEFPFFFLKNHHQLRRPRRKTTKCHLS